MFRCGNAFFDMKMNAVLTGLRAALEGTGAVLTGLRAALEGTRAVHSSTPTRPMFDDAKPPKPRLHKRILAE